MREVATALSAKRHYGAHGMASWYIARLKRPIFPRRNLLRRLYAPAVGRLAPKHQLYYDALGVDNQRPSRLDYPVLPHQSIDK